MRETIERICQESGWTLTDNEIRIPLEKDRHQVVEIEEYEARGVPFVRLFSRLGVAEAVDERRLLASLRLNWTLPYGAVAIAALSEGEPETLLLCDSVARDRISAAPDRVKLALQYLAKTADEYERFVFGTDAH